MEERTKTQWTREKPRAGGGGGHSRMGRGVKDFSAGIAPPEGEMVYREA